MALVIRYVILLPTKTEKKYEVSQTSKKKPPKKNTKLSKSMTKFPPFLKRRHKNHGLDYFTETNLPEGIQLPWTIISQIYRKKKICLKALTIQLSIAYFCDTNNERLKLPIPTVMLHSAKGNPTLDTPKLLNDIPHSHSQVNHVFLKGRNTKCFGVKSQ